mmetsp:Transcript_27506/g.38397  ORF Transcript_27506/g.38397 Transcript_27506/m.38397 type:complete len:110 (-) Transcript_27506:1082-1411(-)
MFHKIISCTTCILFHEADGFYFIKQQADASFHKANVHRKRTKCKLGFTSASFESCIAFFLYCAAEAGGAAVGGTWGVVSAATVVAVAAGAAGAAGAAVSFESSRIQWMG